MGRYFIECLDRMEHYRRRSCGRILHELFVIGESRVRRTGRAGERPALPLARRAGRRPFGPSSQHLGRHLSAPGGSGRRDRSETNGPPRGALEVWERGPISRTSAKRSQSSPYASDLLGQGPACSRSPRPGSVAGPRLFPPRGWFHVRVSRVHSAAAYSFERIRRLWIALRPAERCGESDPLAAYMSVISSSWRRRRR